MRLLVFLHDTPFMHALGARQPLEACVRQVHHPHSSVREYAAY